MKLFHALFACSAFALCGLTSTAHAAIIDIVSISGDSGLGSTVASQIEVELTDIGHYTADLTIRNNGDSDTNFVITAVYIDYEPCAHMLFVDGPENWGPGANPENLPMGSDHGFEADISASADDLAIENGIGINESATLKLFLGRYSFDHFVHALNEHDARLGLHVQSIGSQNTVDSFVNVPEPGSLALLTLGSLMITTRRRG